MFHETCVYEVKIEKQEEFEELVKEVGSFYRSQEGVIEATYVKRTHRQVDFNAAKNGEPAIRLTRAVGKVTYVFHWVLVDELVHARLTKTVLENYYKRFNRCLITMPKIILGETIV